jgi:hypothetical protein
MVAWREGNGTGRILGGAARMTEPLAPPSLSRETT